eukprot:10637038-Karenia_brevis.AAC.1
MMADSTELRYCHSDAQNQTCLWTPVVLEIKAEVERLLSEAGVGHQGMFNAVFLNRYSDKKHAI